MPGLPPEGGFLYVIEKDRPVNGPELKSDLPVASLFNPLLGFNFNINGSSTADMVAYDAVISGCVLHQGVLTVHNGRFMLTWAPKLMNQHNRTYEITNRVTGQPSIGDCRPPDVLLRGEGPDGKRYHSVARILLRGT